MIWLYGDMVTEEVTTFKLASMVTTATGMGTTAADGNAKERDQGNPYMYHSINTKQSFKYGGTPLYRSPYTRGVASQFWSVPNLPRKWGRTKRLHP